MKSRKVKREDLTVTDWLYRLPPPYKEQALTNMLESERYKIVKSIRMAIQSAFIWGKTPEGGKYWSDVANSL